VAAHQSEVERIKARLQSLDVLPNRAFHTK
jgi:hypothetical protein